MSGSVKKVESPIYTFDADSKENMSGKIILIPQADPGYDWLFSHGIVLVYVSIYIWGGFMIIIY